MVKFGIIVGLAAFWVIVIVAIFLIFSQGEPVTVANLEEFEYPYATADMPGAIQNHVSESDWNKIAGIWCMDDSDSVISYIATRSVNSLVEIKTDWLCKIGMKVIYFEDSITLR